MALLVNKQMAGVIVWPVERKPAQWAHSGCPAGLGFRDEESGEEAGVGPREREGRAL